jgi:hypothetical protein
LTNAVNQMRIREDGVDVGTLGTFVTNAGHGYGSYGIVFRNPSAGAHTYKITVQPNATSGSINVYHGTSTPTYIMVEDITLTPAPASTAPSSTVGYVEVTTPQTIGATSTDTDLTGLAVTVTVPAGRRLRITGHSTLRTTVAGDKIVGYIKEGATYLGRWMQSDISQNGAYELGDGSVVVSPSAGTHTYKLTAQRYSGTGVLDTDNSSDRPGFILVEDISSVALPSQVVPGSLVVSSAGRPGNPLIGTTIFETDTGKLWMWDGTAWTLPRNVAGGVLYAPAGDFTGSGAEALSKTSAEAVRYTTPIVATQANRRYKISGFLTGTSGGTYNFAIIAIRRGTTVGGTYLAGEYFARPGVGRQKMEVVAFDVPGAVANCQWVMTHAYDTGVGDLYAPSGLWVEDVGAA